MLNVNLKGFMARNVHTNWIAVKKIYGKGDPSLPMVGHKQTCFFSIGRKVWIRLRKSNTRHLCS